MAHCTITVQGPWATLTAPDSLLAAAAAELTAPKPGAEFSFAYKTGRWDGQVCLLQRRTFAVGLVERVKARLEREGATVAVSRKPVPEPVPFCPALIDVSARSYQNAGADAAIERRVLTLECPTGGGKTLLGAEIIRRLGATTLWLTHRSDLATQTHKVLGKALNQPVGSIGAGICAPSVITVGMVQTLARYIKRRDPMVMKYLAGVKLLIVDEAHHASSATMTAVAEACTSAEYRIGLSGTLPAREALTALLLESVCGPKHVVAEVGDLASQGFLAAPTVRLIEPPTTSYWSYEQVRDVVLPSWRSDPRPLAKLGTKLFDVSRRHNIVENEGRNRAFAAAAVQHYRAGERVLMLCELVAHARRLEQAVRSLGAEKVWCLTGEDKDREEALGRFRSFDPPGLLIATPWFREGMDVPEVDVGFLAGASMSEIAILQGFGRMLRPRPDKATVLVYSALDGIDPSNPKDYFAQHSVEQLRIFRERGWALVRQADWLCQNGTDYK